MRLKWSVLHLSKYWPAVYLKWIDERQNDILHIGLENGTQKYNPTDALLVQFPRQSCDRSISSLSIWLMSWSMITCLCWYFRTCILYVHVLFQTNLSLVNNFNYHTCHLLSNHFNQLSNCFIFSTISMRIRSIPINQSNLYCQRHGWINADEGGA